MHQNPTGVGFPGPTVLGIIDFVQLCVFPPDYIIKPRWRPCWVHWINNNASYPKNSYTLQGQYEDQLHCSWNRKNMHAAS